MFRKIVIFLFLAVLFLCTILVVRTATFVGVDQAERPLPALAELNADSAALRLAQAIRFKTISYYDSSKTDFAEFVAFQDYLEMTFPNVFQTFAVERVNTYSMLMHWQGTNLNLKPALLMAHQDVVPISTGSESDWSFEPFAGAISAGTVFGRGSVDDKSSLLAILEAFEYQIKNGKTPQRSIYLAFGHDEEIGGRNGIAKVVEHLQAQQVELEFVLDEGMVILDNVVAEISGKVAAIGIAEKGYVSLKLSSKSAGGHSSMPPKNTAISELSEAIAALKENPFPANLEYLSNFLVGMGEELPYSQQLIFANLWLFEGLVKSVVSGNPKINAITRTTIAPTIIQAGEKDNVLPINAFAVINLRILPGESVQSVTDYVKKVIGNSAISVEVYNQANEPSPVSSFETETFQHLKDAARAIMQNSKAVVTPALVVAGTDSKHFSEIAKNVYRFQPLVLDAKGVEAIHGTDEKVSIKNYVGMIQFYIAFSNSALF